MKNRFDTIKDQEAQLKGDAELHRDAILKRQIILERLRIFKGIPQNSPEDYKKEIQQKGKKK